MDFPGAIAAVIFPAFSNLQSKDDKKLTVLYARSIKYILLFSGPIVVFIITFSNNILSLWQGSIFAETSTQVLQILVIGV